MRIKDKNYIPKIIKNTIVFITWLAHSATSLAQVTVLAILSTKIRYTLLLLILGIC